MDKLFKCRAQTMGYVFRSGKGIHFIQGRYVTSIPAEIEELTEVCSDPSSVYYIDPEETEFDPKNYDPIAGLKERLRAEILAEQAAACDPSRDMGGTEQPVGTLKGIATSQSIQGLQVQSVTQVPTATPVVPASKSK